MVQVQHRQLVPFVRHNTTLPPAGDQIDYAYGGSCRFIWSSRRRFMASTKTFSNGLT
ncbi:hypothetical protein MTBSS4_660002 [Magnetospirillum sp. SS-4]|nr:hypothetical protein MTBSS4_660002 [Magnetospirillum sp. SS-4]